MGAPRPLDNQAVIQTSILAACCQQPLTINEIKFILAICACSRQRPGQAQTTLAEIARTLKTRKEKAQQMLGHCEARGLVYTLKPVKGLATAVRTFVVADPSNWKLNGCQ